MTMGERIEELHPLMRDGARAFLAECERRRIDVWIYSGRRTWQEQARLWRRGRDTDYIRAKCQQLRAIGCRLIADVIEGVGPQRGDRIVTWALPGQSPHNHGLAFDAAPLKAGRIDWSDLDAFERLGDVGRAVGLEWGGDWKKRDMPHFQHPDWRSLV